MVTGGCCITLKFVEINEEEKMPKEVYPLRSVEEEGFFKS